MPFLTSFAEQFILPLIVAIIGGIVVLLLTKSKIRRSRLWATVVALMLFAGGVTYTLLSTRREKVDRVVSGIVLDESSRNPVRNAVISIINNPGVTYSDNSGNFRVVLDSSEPTPEVVTLRVVASGFEVVEQTIRPPIHDLPISLRRSTK
jgi:hypothetical protein